MTVSPSGYDEDDVGSLVRIQGSRLDQILAQLHDLRRAVNTVDGQPRNQALAIVATGVPTTTRTEDLFNTVSTELVAITSQLRALKSEALQTRDIDVRLQRTETMLATALAKMETIATEIRLVSASTNALPAASEKRKIGAADVGIVVLNAVGHAFSTAKLSGQVEESQEKNEAMFTENFARLEKKVDSLADKMSSRRGRLSKNRR